LRILHGLDPTIEVGLASSADFKKLERVTSSIEQRKEMQIAKGRSRGGVASAIHR
jgi:hypothetical protein